MGLVWYRNDADYQQMLAVYEDAGELPPTLEEWLIRAEKGFKELEKRGVRCVKAIIDPVEFPKWCALHDHKLDRSGRLAFANWTAMQSLHDS